jgi:hypothetical protein
MEQRAGLDPPHTAGMQSFDKLKNRSIYLLTYSVVLLVQKKRKDKTLPHILV